MIIYIMNSNGATLRKINENLFKKYFLVIFQLMCSEIISDLNYRQVTKHRFITN